MEKRFYRSATDCKIASVCGGLGEYFGIAPLLVRIAFVVAVWFAGVGFWTYILL